VWQYAALRWRTGSPFDNELFGRALAAQESAAALHAQARKALRVADELDLSPACRRLLLELDDALHGA
jgi:hypothetical protein